MTFESTPSESIPVVRELPLNPNLPRDRAYLDAGGLWSAWYMADPDEIVTMARKYGVRALEYNGPHAELVAELPQLEYLLVGYVRDPETLYRFDRLRGLHVTGTWEGKIDFQRLPHLKFFSVTECPRDEGGLESLYAGHPTLRELTIQRYRHENLMPLTRLNLRRLGIQYARKLKSLKGIAMLAPSLRRLCLYVCPNLPSLDELSSVPGLESLEVGTLRNITTLEFTQALPRLRRLDLFELKSVETLWPLACHPSLEFLMFGRVRDLDLGPLLTLNRLKLFHSGNYRWNLDLDTLPALNNFPDDHPYIAEWHSLEP